MAEQVPRWAPLPPPRQRALERLNKEQRTRRRIFSVMEGLGQDLWQGAENTDWIYKNRHALTALGVVTFAFVFGAGLVALEGSDADRQPSP